MIIKIPDSWRDRRLYFAVIPTGFPVKETLRLSRRESKQAAEEWTGATWRHLSERRWSIESVK